jgi:ribonuclease HI
LLFASQEQILTGSELETTNNRMELTAAIQALKAPSYPSQVDFYTDW